MPGKEIQIAAKDGGQFMAYIAMPETLPAPAVIVIQEIFGVNQELRDKCNDLAAQGYIAICPDLFWRMEPNVQLTDKTEEEWQKAFGFFQNFDIDLGIEDLRATLHTMRGHADCNGKVGAIGYCLGGKLAYMMAARTGVDCSVGYYGVGLGSMLDEADGIKNPLLLHIAEDDEYVPTEEQEIIVPVLSDHPHVTIHSYPGAKHAFARGQGINYNEEAASAANIRTKDFLQTHLQPAKAA